MIITPLEDAVLRFLAINIKADVQIRDVGAMPA
jgi:hypothetical protein